jgi:hypothetical protein
LIDRLEAAARSAQPPRPAQSPAALPFRALVGAAVLRYRVRAWRDLLLHPLYAQAALWGARRSAGSERLQRLAVSFRQREDRALDRLEWLGALERGRRLPAEKWVYRRLAAERQRRTGAEPATRLRAEKWVADVARASARKTKVTGGAGRER